MSAVELHELSRGEAPILSALFELYRYDFSEFTGEDVDAAGRFDDAGRAQKYVSEASFMPFLIRVGRLAASPTGGPIQYFTSGLSFGDCR